MSHIKYLTRMSLTYEQTISHCRNLERRVIDVPRTVEPPPSRRHPTACISIKHHFSSSRLDQHLQLLIRHDASLALEVFELTALEIISAFPTE